LFEICAQCYKLSMDQLIKGFLLHTESAEQFVHIPGL